MKITSSIGRDLSCPFVGAALLLYGVMYAIIVGPIRLVEHLFGSSYQSSFFAFVAVILLAVSMLLGLVGYERTFLLSVMAAIISILLYVLTSVTESVSERKRRKSSYF